MVKINGTDESKKWLREIFYYIAEDNRKIAQKVIDDIIERTTILKTFPTAGQRLFDRPNMIYECLLYGHFRIIYSITPKERIDILGVYHGALNLSTPELVCSKLPE